MPSIGTIVDVNISVQSSQLTRKGFNSLMLVGDFDDFGVGFSEHEVRIYENYEAVIGDTDIVDGKLKNMLQVAFSQSPSVPKLYVSMFDSTGDGGTSGVGTVSIASSDLEAIAQNNNDWFGYASVFNADADIIVQDTFCSASKKYGFYLKEDATEVTCSNFGTLWHTKESDIAKKWVQVAVASNILAKVVGSYNVAYQELVGVSTSSYTGTEEQALRDANINQYSIVAGQAVTYNGATGSGSWVDLWIGVLFLEARIQEDVFAQLKAVEKIPFTNAGISLISSAVQARLTQSVEEGFLTDDPAPEVFAPLASEINPTDKSNRLLAPVKFTATTTGAVNAITINGTIVA